MGDCCRRNRALVVGHIGFDYYVDLEYPYQFPDLKTKNDFEKYIKENNLSPYLGGTAGNTAAVMRAIGSLEVDRFTCGDLNGVKRYNDMTPLVHQEPHGMNKSISADDPYLCVPICLIFSKDEQQQVLLYDHTLHVYNSVQEFNLVGGGVEYELLHITTVPPNATLKMVEEAHEKSPNTLISFCPGQNLKLYAPKTFFKVLEYVNILFVNDNEMKMVSEWALSNSNDFKSFPDLIVHTRGSRATVISSKDGVEHVPTIKPLKLVDTTGAGDSYAGAFLSSYMVHKDPIRAAKFAATVASFIIEEVGCQTNIPTLEQRRERCKTWTKPLFSD